MIPIRIDTLPKNFALVSIADRWAGKLDRHNVNAVSDDPNPDRHPGEKFWEGIDL
jgi:hypothetical protein